MCTYTSRMRHIECTKNMDTHKFICFGLTKQNEDTPKCKLILSLLFLTLPCYKNK